MHCQTKKYSSLFFLFLFILNFKSLNTESNSILNNFQDQNDKHSSESNSSSCVVCSSTLSIPSPSPTFILPSNSSFLSKISPAFESSSASSRYHSSSDSSSDFSPNSNSDSDSNSNSSAVFRTNPLNLRSFNRHSITFRSTPHFVLLPDLPFAAMTKLQSSRKKQLDLDFEPVSIKTDLNYRLDETETRGDENESEAVKVKLKQNIDTSKDRSEIKDKETENSKMSPQIDRQANKHLARQTEMQPDKQVERKTDSESNRQQNKQSEKQSDKRSDENSDRPLSSRPQHPNAAQQADKQLIDKQSDKPFGQEASQSGAESHRPFNERRNERNNELRNRRLNEQLIRRLKPSRQPATQSNFSILRRFYPSQSQLQINANRYSVEDARLATLEIVKVQKDGRCKAPTKRVIPIYKLLNDSHQMKRFLPHCTILHRCESETGCCNSESEQCSMKKQEPVRLPFWVISLSADGQQFKTIEWFTFHNHTECECRMK